MDRSQKSEEIDALEGVFSQSGVVVVAHYAGLTVAELTGFRVRLREANAKLQVVKNRLAQIALTRVNGETSGTALFKGPAAILFAKDPVETSKLALDFSKQNDKFVVLGAILGASVLDQDGVKALSTMPSLDEMRAKLAGTLSAPGSKFVRQLNAPGVSLVTAMGGVGRNLANVLSAHKAKLETAA